VQGLHHGRGRQHTVVDAFVHRHRGRDGDADLRVDAIRPEGVIDDERLAPWRHAMAAEVSIQIAQRAADERR